MSKILPDRELKALLGKVILNSSEECVRVQAYEVRLGKKARFDSTGEEFEIEDGKFLEIDPGDFVTVESLERLDLRADALKSCGKNFGIFAWVTPTTTMMREALLFASTKVDVGYHGTLNWGIRNSFTKTVTLQQGERLFKLTFMELAEDEKPDKVYGDNPQDHYQGTNGIKESARMVPANIPDRSVVRRSHRRIDPIKQLTQAGYPFNHIGTELIELQGKWEIVSKDVVAMKESFETLEKNIEKKIDAESNSISTIIAGLPDKIDAKTRGTFAEQFGLYFDQRMQRVYGTLAALITFCFALYKLLVQTVPSNSVQGWILLGIGIIVLVATLLLTKRHPTS